MSRGVRRNRWACFLVLSALAAGGCGTAGPAVESEIARATMATVSPAISAPSTDAPSATPACPNPGGGVCLGPLEAGTYSTQTFEPQLTYSVPAGWDNEEDLPGNFLLLPPGSDLDGVDAGTSDYLGVYSHVAPDPACQPASGERFEGAKAVATCIAGREDLVTTEPEPVEIGGLSGYVLDVKLSRATTGGTSLIAGISPSSLEHGVIPGLTIRLYLLDSHGTALAIEVDDVDAPNLDEYSAVVEQFSFER